MVRILPLPVCRLRPGVTARIETPLTRLLGLDVPIVQAPIGGIATPELAAAVSNAGGLGTLSLTWREPDDARSVIRDVRRRTDRSFGINLILVWDQAERVRVALDEGVRLISFFWGDPAPFVDQIHAAGSLVALTVGSAAEARTAVESGVDVIVAQGWEAGGHVWGQVATMPLVPAVVDAAGDVPVVAAGGIGDGRGLAAALALGASGVWMGTRFVMARESLAHPRYRELVAGASEADTHYGTLFDGGWTDAPHRTLRNSTVAQWLAAGSPPPGSRPGEGDEIVRDSDGEALPRYASSAVRADLDGEIEAMSLWAGQSAGVVREVLPAAEILERIAEEASSVIQSLPPPGEADR